MNILFCQHRVEVASTEFKMMCSYSSNKQCFPRYSSGWPVESTASHYRKKSSIDTVCDNIYCDANT